MSFLRSFSGNCPLKCARPYLCWFSTSFFVKVVSFYPVRICLSGKINMNTDVNTDVDLPVVYENLISICVTKKSFDGNVAFVFLQGFQRMNWYFCCPDRVGDALHYTTLLHAVFHLVIFLRYELYFILNLFRILSLMVNQIILFNSTVSVKPGVSICIVPIVLHLLAHLLNACDCR